MKNFLEIVYSPIAAIKPSPHAARHHSCDQRRKLKTLLTKFGQVTPVMVDKTNHIVDGHAVYDTLVELGYEEIAVVVAANRSDADIRLLRLALNRISQDAKWDDAKLRGEFEALISLGSDLELSGFDAVEIDMALSVEDPSGNVVDEATREELEPNQGTAITQPGDVWRLDPHILLCADAREGHRLLDLLAGRQATVVFTDPPYNVRIGGNVSGLGKVKHREFAMASGEMDRNAFVTFLSAFFAAAKPTLTDGAIIYACMDWRHIGEILEAGMAQGLELKNVCVWVKSNAGMGTFYRSQHEFVFVFKHGTGPHKNNFGLGEHGRSRSNVWNYRGVNVFGKDRRDLLGSHPTVKPVTMVADALRDVSRRGDVVLDPFLGSGSTLIAAEETGRVCVGVELDPSYVDVAVRRWQKRTGKEAIHVRTGQTFSFLAKQRAASAPRPAEEESLTTGDSIAPTSTQEEGDDV